MCTLINSSSSAIEAKIDIIDANVDNLITTTNNIDTDTSKITDVPTGGLASDVNNSLAYRVAEIEGHFHVREHWWGAVAVPDETNAIDQNVDTPFQATSGNNTWGTAIPILGTADDPCFTGCTKFDAHLILVSDGSQTNPYLFRIIYGTGTSADAITAEQYSEVMLTLSSTNRVDSPVEIRMPRVSVGWKMWVQIWNATDAATLDFHWGCHGYEG